MENKKLIQAQYNRDYYKKNKEKIKAYQRKYKRENKDKIRKLSKEWRKNNPIIIKLLEKAINYLKQHELQQSNLSRKHHPGP